MIGIIGYLVLTGKHPFADPAGLFSIPDLLSDPNFTPATPRPATNLTSSEQRLFREYGAIILRLLHREKASRFATARDAVDAIDAVEPSIECPACHERGPDHNRFCGNCGMKFAAAVPPEKVVAPTTKANASSADLVEEGFLLTQAQRWGEAIRTYRQAIEKDPKFQRAYWNLGYALNRIGEYEEAAEILSTGLALPGGTSEHRAQLYYARSFAFSNLKQYAEALDDITHALTAQPDSPKFIFLKARIHVYLGDTEAARRNADEVLRLAPGHVGAIRLLDELRQ